MREFAGAQAVVGGLLDLVLPKRCVACGRAGAWLARRLCARAASPARRALLRGAPAPRGGCRECRERTPWFVTAGAAFTYDGAAKALVTVCKFRAYRSVVDEMVGLARPAFAAAAARLGDDPRARAADPKLLVTWVPGHRDHVLERGFNQAEGLARGLARATGLPCAPLLERVRHGARQSGLGRHARAANVSQSFAVREDAERVVRMFKRVMIVDDVYTTGETLSHGAEVLINTGLEPHTFTFARTVRAVPSQNTIDAAVRKERCR
ncbi:MAG: hypothetical protein R2826_00240 [Thermoleophilia bacterium]